ncbi:ATP-binding protein [Vibrio parahaemolyticus]|uniref:ATP-binding protein n=1 Tax=Vibrio parahaemolyticus TaxID=670 RepID=UPI0011228AC5|nr:ATP-binding protein [Vibrio parahaemolyticus]TOE32546.1 ATP-binding protein [Vibrio parahaemolyticus]
MAFRARIIGDTSLFKGESSAENAFTIVIGDNGCGKTQLLLDICNYYQMLFGELLGSKSADIRVIRRDYFKQDFKWGAIEKAFEHQIPQKLICASTSQFEKFAENWKLKNDFVQGGYYAYIGSKPFAPDRLPSTRIASTALNQLLARDTYDARKIQSLRKFLLSFGFDDVLKISLEPIFSFDELNKAKSGDPDVAPETQIALRKANEYYEIEDISELILLMEFIIDKPEVLLYFSDSGVLLDSVCKEKPIPYNSRELADLLMSGLVSVANIETVNGQCFLEPGLSESAKLRPLASRSSGEQCLFLLFLGIISSIDDNSLILIDEPEISLHPSWQQRFVEILNESLSEYSGCHFIIATHSPLIVSDIAVKNCEILDMTEQVLTSASKHSLRSSDYHLATLFHNPGHSNEYPIKTAIYVFSKVKSEKKFDNQDLEKLKMLNDQLSMLHEDDPVIELVEMLNEVYCKYG